MSFKPLQEYLKTLNLDSFMGSKIIKINVPLIGYHGLHKDTSKYPYWSVNTSSFDDQVQAYWNEGKLILNHKILSEAIVMTKDQFEKHVKHPETTIIDDGNWETWNKIEQEIMEAYLKASNEIEASGKLTPGYIYTSPVADGQAHYLVTKITKASVFLVHMNFIDGYQDMMINSMNGKVPLKTFMNISFFGHNTGLGAIPFAR